ncbi:MAG TPA: EF-hand domain-containing protein [Sphingomicrobium sp.]|nr:EF-hand domain-containing protein [Sphingomicrobium sp.]
MKMIIVSVVLGATVAAAPALAQAPGGSSGQRDQTRAEVQQRADMMFQMLDSNHDGVVTRQEAEQAAAQFAARVGSEGRSGGRMQRLIEQAFGSAQSITRQQFEAQLLARFDAMDLNHDGVVTAAEREQFRAQRSARGAGTESPVSAPVTATPPSPGQ